MELTKLVCLTSQLAPQVTSETRGAPARPENGARSVVGSQVRCRSQQPGWPLLRVLRGRFASHFRPPQPLQDSGVPGALSVWRTRWREGGQSLRMTWGVASKHRGTEDRAYCFGREQHGAVLWPGVQPVLGGGWLRLGRPGCSP